MPVLQAIKIVLNGTGYIAECEGDNNPPPYVTTAWDRTAEYRLTPDGNNWKWTSGTNCQYLALIHQTNNDWTLLAASDGNYPQEVLDTDPLPLLPGVYTFGTGTATVTWEQTE